jgi:hypothetical protein
MDEGFQIALGFFVLGLLWMFIASWVIAGYEFLRRLLG